MTPIRTAYEAFWFLTDHPKFKCREARLLTPAEARSIKLSRGERLRKVKDNASWRKGETYWLHEFALRRKAMTTNLNIFYTKVDKHGKVNDDVLKNINVECWLEFGELKQEVVDGHLYMQHYHDVRLDCGASTFDEALIKLALRVRRHYGDYKVKA